MEGDITTSVLQKIYNKFICLDGLRLDDVGYGLFFFQTVQSLGATSALGWK